MMINRGETQWGGRRSCSGPILIIFSFYQRVFGIWDYCLDRNMIFTFVTFFFNFRSWFNYKFAKSLSGVMFVHGRGGGGGLGLIFSVFISVHLESEIIVWTEIWPNFQLYKRGSKGVAHIAISLRWSVK